MKYCSKCGKELADDAIFCTHCGSCVEPGTNASYTTPKEDNISVGYCILAFLFPIFGLIYWVVKKDETPRKANAVGITALISWVSSVVSSIIMSSIWAKTVSDVFSNFLV